MSEMCTFESELCSVRQLRPPLSWAPMTADDTTARSGPLAPRPSRASLMDVRTGKLVPVRDLRGQIAEITRRTPLSALERDRVNERRRARLKRLSSRMHDAAAAPLPSPGGVGDGFMFRDGRLTFNTSTCATYSIIAPPRLGEASQALLYLTTTNRASKGTESLVSYQS